MGTGTQDQSATANAPVWQKFTIPYTSIQTAALTNLVTLLTLPAKAIVHECIMNVTTAFSGTTTLTLSCGPSGSIVKYSTAQSGTSTGVLGGTTLNAPTAESMSSGTTIQLSAVATVQNLSSLTQGSVDVYLLISQLQ